MNDFWLSCGFHLLDRDSGGGLIVTDEFLKAYLVRPELAPPPEACVVERTLHATLMREPRRPVKDSEIAATFKPNQKEHRGTWTDPKPSPGVHYYYVRAEQIDGQLAWGSPMWIEYEK